jgi:hypothetical protein
MLNGFMPSIMDLLKSLLLKTCIQMLPPCIGGVSTLLFTKIFVLYESGTHGLEHLGMSTCISFTIMNQFNILPCVYF